MHTWIDMSGRSIYLSNLPCLYVVIARFMFIFQELLRSPSQEIQDYAIISLKIQMNFIEESLTEAGDEPPLDPPRGHKMCDASFTWF